MKNLKFFKQISLEKVVFDKILILTTNEEIAFP